MAITDNAVGSQASGLAGVLGSSINPLEYLMKQQARQQKNQADLNEEYRKQRDKLMDYNEQYNPSSKFAEFNYRIADRAQREVRDFTMDSLGKASFEDINNERQRRIGVLNAYTSEVDQWKQTLDNIETEIKKGEDAGIYKKNAVSAVRDIYMTPSGQLKEDGEIRQGMANIENIFNDPSIYNKTGVISNWVKNLPEQSRAVYSKKMNQGYSPTDLEVAVTSKLKYETDEDGYLKLNEQGEKIPIIDKASLELAKLDTDLKFLIEAYGGETEQGQIDWLKQNIPGGIDAVKTDRKIIRGNKIDTTDQWKRFGFSGRVDPELVKERFNNDEEIVNSFRPDLLASTFSPYKDQEVYYADAKGNKVVKEENGEYIGEDASGKPIKVGNPVRLAVEFGVKTSALLAAITGTEEKVGKVTKDFDITTPSGRKQAHQALNRILDEDLSLKDRYGEDYTKILREKYEGNKKTKEETGGVY